MTHPVATASGRHDHHPQTRPAARRTELLHAGQGELL